MEVTKEITTKVISFEYLCSIIESIAKDDSLSAETRLRIVKALLEELSE